MDAPVTKACFECGETKPLSDFYKHPKMSDGHVNKCKECTKQGVKDNREKRKDYYDAYDRLRSTEPHRKQQKKERESRPDVKEKSNAYKRVWSQSEEAKRKKSANTTLGNAVRDGKIVKLPCWVCGSTEDVEGHHANYDDPLGVIWLCTKHHAECHRDYDHEEDKILLETTRKGCRWDSE